MKLIIPLICAIVFVVVPGFDLLRNAKSRPALTVLATLYGTAAAVEDVNTVITKKPEISDLLNDAEARLHASEIQRMELADALLRLEMRTHADKIRQLEQNNVAQVFEIAALKKAENIPPVAKVAAVPAPVIVGERDNQPQDNIIKVNTSRTRFTTNDTYAVPASVTPMVIKPKKESAFSRSSANW